MASRWNLQILVLYLCFLVVLSLTCREGLSIHNRTCVDIDECEEDEDYGEGSGPCVENAVCHNTYGSFYCQCVNGTRSTEGEIFSAGSTATCKDINECLEEVGLCGPNANCHNAIPNYSCICAGGFISSTGVENFRHGDNVTCRDIDECKETSVDCGENTDCVNTPGSYYCVCKDGFRTRSGIYNFTENHEQCEDICAIDKTICGNGTCHRGASSHYCQCYQGFTNYGNKESQCTAINCDAFKDLRNLKEIFHVAQDFMKQLNKSCVELAESENPTDVDGDDLLERLLSLIDELLSSAKFKDNRQVSTFLDIVENTLKLVGPFIKPPGRKRSSNYSEFELRVHQGRDLPQGSVTLLSSQAEVDIQFETAAGHLSSYPGFATVSLMSYDNLENFAKGFSGMKQTNQSFEINSKVVTVTVSNRNTSHLEQPVNLTFYHLKATNDSNHTCVFWNSSEDGGSWSPNGCQAVESNFKYTVCSCNHLSSFAVLMARHEIKYKFELQLITWVGLSLSLICLFICILTFGFIRTIQSPRTTIHLHLCISLFIASFIFLVGISRTENKVGCAVVAGLLHYFYLAAFCWMCLEGIQLFRMVVLVFNTSFKTRYMMAGGYGVPAVIVGISALLNAKGYGTEKYCWLNLNFIWTFFAPVCVIILINIFFFLITVWKLAEKFTSLNPDLNNLQKIKAFTITAVAQLCVLGTMWIFGCFQFEEGTIVMSYLFTIFGSLQGVMLFVMHCLFSKQVREEYGLILSRCCAPTKTSYSEFISSHSSKAQTSKSTQDTGESHI